MDDDFDFGGYTPTLNVNSRSGSMKKLTRKTDKSPAPGQTKPSNKNNDFDELDDLLNGDIKPKKKDTSLNKNQSSSLPKKANDTLDSFFDEPSTNLNLTSKINEKKEPALNNKMDMARTSINWKMERSDKKSDFDIIDEDHLMPNFSKAPKERPRSPTTNQIKMPEDNSFALDSHTSMRNMRPPLKRKESQTGLGGQTSNFGLGLSLAEQKKEPTLNPSNTFGLSLIEESEFKPTRSMNTGGRRGSIDNKSEKRFDTNLTLGQEPASKQVNVSHFNIPEKNERSTLKIDSPKNKGRSQISEMKIGESIMINQRHSQFYNQQNNASNNISILRNDSFKPTETNIQGKESSYSFDKPHVKLVEPPKLSPNPPQIEQHSRQVSTSSYDYQKQVEHIKQAYQKQLNYLQESLDRQITIGQQTRQRLMKEANSMIEEERKRLNRIHEEEVRRLKDINDWEKRKMEDSYKFQIQNLKSSISQYQAATQERTQSNGKSYEESNNNNRYKREIQQLSDQLQLQKKLLFDRENHLNKRQLELEEKLQQLNSKRTKQDEYFRDQQKLLLEKETKMRNGILNEKKDFMEEKQKMAMEAANMELDMMKRKEKLDFIIKEQELEKHAIESERHEMRLLNQQMMAKYKEKVNELQQDKERVAGLQADLIRKLRIIELKAKESNVPLNMTQQNNQTKENNWVRERPQSTAAEKQEKLNETFQRYNKVEKLANQHSGISTSKMNKTMEQTGQGFKLQEYLVAMNKNSKSRQNNFM